MNKTELVDKIATRTNSTKKATEATLEALIDVISEALSKKEKVQLVGFGTFEAKTRAARKGHNPQTGEEIKVPSCIAPTFKAGKALKDIVNK